LVLTPGPQGGLLTTTNFFNPGSDLVTILLDGVTQQTYFPSGYSISGNDSDSDFDGPVLLGVTATNIGIRFDFALSPGAKAQVTGSIDYVPAPAGLAIFGLAGIMGRRRRRD
jgi:LPXTG-motif cell wall-anchored protein